jgi:hypothetical protein
MTKVTHKITHNGKDFKIDSKIHETNKELITLILNTDSMDNEERQYWFDILPSMDKIQVQKLYDILDTEKQKLDKLDDKYQDDIKNLNEKHLVEWQEFQMKDKTDKIKKEEAEDNIKDAEDVLKMLDDI